MHRMDPLTVATVEAGMYALQFRFSTRIGPCKVGAERGYTQRGRQTLEASLSLGGGQGDDAH